MRGANRLYRHVRPLIAAVFYYSGLVPLARWYVRLRRQHLIILTYHRAAGGNLRRHFLYLRRHYRVLPLETALEELYAPSNGRPGFRDRRTPLVITFDDGYRDNYTHAYALANELAVPITIFLLPGYVADGHRFHWLEGNYLANHAAVDKATISGRTYHLNTAQDRQALAHVVYTRARYARSVAEREAFLASARRLLTVPAEATSEEQLTFPVTWTEVLSMQTCGWVTYGAHTMHHPVLSWLSDPADVEYEIGESRALLEQRLGHHVYTFAYPYGRMTDIGEHALWVVHRAGYRWAVTAMPGFNTPRTDPCLLRRMPTDVREHGWVLAAQAAGVWWGIWSILPAPLQRRLESGESR